MSPTAAVQARAAKNGVTTSNAAAVTAAANSGGNRKAATNSPNAAISPTSASGGTSGTLANGGTNAPVAPTNSGYNDKGLVNPTATQYNGQGIATSAGTDITAPTNQTLGTDLAKFGKDAYGLTAEQMGKRNDTLAENAAAGGVKNDADLKSYLEKQQGFMNSSAEEQAHTLQTIGLRMGLGATPAVTPTPTVPLGPTPGQQITDGMNGDQITANEIALTNAANKEIGNEKTLEGMKNNIINKQNEMANLQGQQQLDKAGEQLQNMKQAIAYIGQGGNVGISSVHIEAISKQVASAQNTYDTLVKLQQDQKDLQSMNVSYNATAFAQQIASLQDKLNQQVNPLVQDAINALEQSSSSGKIDNMDDFNTIKNQISTQLDAGIANFAQTNSAERAQVLDWYNNAIQIQQDYTKASNTVNEAMSKSVGYIMDGNGNKMLVDGKPIAYVGDTHTSYDSASGTLIQYNDAGEFSVHQITQGKQDMITLSDRLAISKAVTSGEITQEQANAMLGGSNPNFTNTNTSNTTQNYQGPEYTPISQTDLTSAVQDLSANPAYKVGTNLGARGECGAFVNDWLKSTGVSNANIVTNTYAEKQSLKNSDTAQAGNVAIVTSAAHPDNGHVAIVMGVNKDGSVHVKESNWAGDHTIHERDIAAKDIYGYFDPTKNVTQKQTSNVDYNQYGLLSKTDFNPDNQVDVLADKYLDIYLKNGTMPTATLVLGSSRAKNLAEFQAASARAEELYFKATGEGLPDITTQKAYKTMEASNIKLLNSLKIQEGTVKSNFDLMITNIDKNGVNQSVPAINKWWNNINSTFFGDPNTAQYLVQNATISNEISSLLAVKNAGGTTVADKLEAAGLLKEGYSSAQLKQALNTLMTEANNAQKAVQEQQGELYKYTDPLETTSNNPNRGNTLNPTSTSAIQPGTTTNSFQSLRDSL